MPPLPEQKKNASFLGVTCETRASLLGTGHDHAPRALYPVFVDVSIRFPGPGASVARSDALSEENMEMVRFELF